MEAAIIALAEQGHWFIATVFLAAGWIIERRMSAKLRAHDAKNDEDFKEVRGRLHDISERLARIEGALTVKRKEE